MARVLMKGCEAIAEAAVRAGCRFFAGYPITPQNEIPEYFARRMPEVGGVFVQGESEVASVNMVYGAAQTGTRAMTSSSSPSVLASSSPIWSTRETVVSSVCSAPSSMAKAMGTVFNRNENTNNSEISVFFIVFPSSFFLSFTSKVNAFVSCLAFMRPASHLA